MGGHSCSASPLPFPSPWRSSARSRFPPFTTPTRPVDRWIGLPPRVGCSDPSRSGELRWVSPGSRWPSPLVSDFISKFLHDVHPGWGSHSRGILGAVGLVSTIPGSLLGTWASERGADRRLVAGLVVLVFGTLAITIPFLDAAELVADFVGLGLMAGATLPIFFEMLSHIPEVQGAGRPSPSDSWKPAKRCARASPRWPSPSPCC